MNSTPGRNHGDGDIDVGGQTLFGLPAADDTTSQSSRRALSSVAPFFGVVGHGRKRARSTTTEIPSPALKRVIEVMEHGTYAVACAPMRDGHGREHILARLIRPHAKEGLDDDRRHLCARLAQLIHELSNERDSSMLTARISEIRFVAQAELRLRMAYEKTSMPTSRPGFLSQLPSRYPHLSIVARVINILVDELERTMGHFSDPGIHTQRITAYVTKLILLIVRQLQEVAPSTGDLDDVDSTRIETRVFIDNVLQHDPNWIQGYKPPKGKSREVMPEGHDRRVDMLHDLLNRARSGRLRHLPGFALDTSTSLEFTLEHLSTLEMESLLPRITFSSEAEIFDDIPRDANYNEAIEKSGASAVNRLAKRSLQPHHRITIGTSIFYLSGCSLVDVRGNDPDRIYTMLYIEMPDGKLMARPCTRSKSQGIWRLIPASTEFWHSKGFGEDGIALSAELQKAMSVLGKPTLGMESDKIVAMTGKRDILPSSTFVTKNNIRPLRLGMFCEPSDSESGKQRKLDPGEHRAFSFFDISDKPDFSVTLASWSEKIPLYGETLFEVFGSTNGKYRYIFCKDKKNRAWIASIDVAVSPFTTSGIRFDWVDGGDLTTPAFEYLSQAGKYGDSGLRAGVGNKYVDVFRQYVSRLPLIQEYLAKR